MDTKQEETRKRRRNKKKKMTMMRRRKRGTVEPPLSEVHRRGIDRAGRISS